jgi:FkbM family methyltransferase
MYLVRHLALRLQSLAGKTIVHVGAHRGEEAELYDRWGAARVIWIEADPTVAVDLRANLAALKPVPRVWLARKAKGPTRHQVIEALVGDEDGKPTDFYIFSNGGASNSIFRKDDNHPKMQQVIETGEVKRLHMRQLDGLLAENGIAPHEVDILVLDVQGAELLCLKGATQVLQHARLIEAEVSKTSFYQNGVLLPELDAWLAAKGFTRRTWVRRNSMNAIYTARGR